MTLRYCVMAGALALLLIACGDDQSVNPGNSQNPSTDSGADASGVVVQVSYQGQSMAIDLGTLATTSYKGVNLVKLSDVWTASQINADRTTLEFEFVAEYGFKPSKKGCADLSGAVLDKGYIDPASRNISWDESLGFEGCYSVRNTAQMNAHVPTGGNDAGATDAAAE